MILLSALLASLTGLVAGERPAERAQVELSAVAAVAKAGEAAVQATERLVEARPAPGREAPQPASAYHSVPAAAGRALLSLKQSWLH